MAITRPERVKMKKTDRLILLKEQILLLVNQAERSIDNNHIIGVIAALAEIKELVQDK